ncbi:MAG: trypsin-like peptidase domain-containing protein [Maricaulaceae bacterium]|nr:trypsin-like peptidase domain-containing protein [Maricaulaceae bacterium]
MDARVRLSGLAFTAVIAATAALSALAGVMLTPVRAGGDEARAAARALPGVVAIHVEQESRLFPVMADAGGVADIERAPGHEWRNGSGFVFDSSGLIATNHHVVAGARRVLVRLADGTVLEASLIGGDPRTDLALLRVSAPAPLAALPFAPSARLRPGERVLALGSPLDFPFSVTAGVIGGFGRAYDGADGVDYVQHDAALNPGNSGGPLIDLSGRVVGVNTATPRETLFDIGVGLAIPSEIAGPVLRRLAEQGHAPRGFLGVSLRGLDAALAEGLGTPPGGGVVVEALTRRSPAERAGLEPGDVIIAMDGSPVRAPRDVNRRLLGAAPGDEVRLEVLRGGESFTIAAVLDEPPGEAVARGGIGPAPRAAASFGLGFENAPGGGVRIDEVTAGSPAARAGLMPGDWLLAVGVTSVHDADAARAALEAADMAVALYVKRDGEAPRFLGLSRGATPAGPPMHSAFAGASGGPY